MEREEALRRYPEHREVILDYSDEEKYITVNDDQDMRKIFVETPKSPDWHLIEGFGLPARMQKWKRPFLPRNLLDLQKSTEGMTIERMWEVLENKREEYAKEIDFIKRMWYHRLNGYWFFNNGVPTYVTGKHFYYMSFFCLDSGYPKYRNRDRKYWLMIDFIYNCTFDFVDKDENGFAIPLSEKDDEGDDVYLIKDTGRRLFFGDVYPKMRREGATYRAECNNLETISRTRNAWGGIQSRNDKDAKDVFVKKLVRPFKKMPFFFKPIQSGNTDPKSVLMFDSPSIRQGKGGNIAELSYGLESGIDFQVGDEGAYDGQKLHFDHDDEVGKNTKNNVWDRHLIKKECLSQAFGRSIHGYTSKTSTAGEFESGGGRVFEKMCKMSDFYQRSDVGQTASGLCAFFITSVDGMEDTMDDYGNSNVEEAIKVVEANRKILLDKGDQKGWLEKVRQYPIYYRECFATGLGDLGFNMAILEKRVGDLKMGDSKTVTGNFIRQIPGDRMSAVMFEPNINGRFIVSHQMKSHESNQMVRGDGGHYMPVPIKGKIINIGLDPFRMNQTETGKMSDAGMVGKWRFDADVDRDKTRDKWDTGKFVFSYQCRPDTTLELAEDVLMACQYYNAMVLCESNVSEIINKFSEWEMYGYLKHIYDSSGTKYRSTPGYPTLGTNKDDIFKAIRDYIDVFGPHDNHVELLQDFKDIKSTKEMTRYDRFTAAGLACLAEEKSDQELRSMQFGLLASESIDMPFRSRRF